MSDYLNALRGIVDMTTNSDPSTNFHVEHAYGSIIGTQQSATITNDFDLRALDVEIDRRGGEDALELKRMTRELQERLENDDQLPKGALAKFSAVLERNSWITSSVAQAVINWATKSAGG
jgi:hypothetical protein